MEDIMILVWVIVAVAGIAFIILYIATIVKFFQMASDLREIKEHLVPKKEDESVKN